MGKNHLEYEYIPKTDTEINGEELALQEALDRIATKEQRIREAYENEIDTLEEYKQNKIRLNTEREQLTSALEQLRKKTQQKDALPPSQEEVLSKVSYVYGVLSDPDVDNETKGNALRAICKKIVFNRETRHFTFYYYTS